MVEGPILARMQDQRQDSFQIVEHISRGNSQRFEPSLSELRVSSGVFLGIVAH